LSRWDGTTFKHFAAPDDIGDNEVWNVYEDRQGNIWFSSEGYGVYRYDGKSLENFSEKEGLGVRAVQSIHQDRAGKLWFGGGGGLYRLDGDTMVHVKRNGPWR
jgi:ligand-binding sensor domain-containing protein